MNTALTIGLTFAGSLGIAIAVWAEGSYRLRERTLEQRVLRVSQSAISRNAVLLREPSALAKLSERIVDLFGPANWPRKIPASRVLINGLVTASLAGLFAHFLLSLAWWLTAATVATLLVLTPSLILKAEQRKSERRFEVMLADTIDMMVRMLRAGMPVTVAVSRVGKEAQEPAAAIYREIAEWLNLGLPLPEAMRTVAERIKIKDFDFFAAALSIQSTVGGNLTATLESLASMIRERNITTLKARAVTAQARLTANIILGILPAIAIVMQLTQPRYMAPLVDGSHGYGLITFVAGSYAAALITIRRLVSKVKIY